MQKQKYYLNKQLKYLLNNNLSLLSYNLNNNNDNTMQLQLINNNMRLVININANTQQASICLLCGRELCEEVFAVDDLNIHY